MKAENKKRDAAIVLLVFNEIDGLREVFDRIPIDRFMLTISCRWWFYRWKS